MRWARRFAAGSALAVAVLAASAEVHAQATTASPTAADKNAAARKFGEGERAFKAGQFAAAADAFEEAHRLAPHPAPLWNAARARQRAGERARAANLFARYLREAPPSAPNHADATASLGELAKALGLLEIVESAAVDLRVDGAPAPASQIYVEPGEHLVTAKLGERAAERRVTAPAGKTTQVTLAEPQAPAPAPSIPPAAPPASAQPSAPAPTPSPPPSPFKPEAPPARRGWSPIWVVVGSGTTVVLGSLTVLSMVGAANFQKEKVDTAPPEDKSAREEEHTRWRNFNFGLIGLSGAALILTGVAAIWLVDWGGRQSSARVALALGPTGLVATGSF